jgi:predicted Zn-dependent protease
MTPAQRIDSAYRYRDEDKFAEAWAEMQAVPKSARGTRDYLMLVASVAAALGKWHEAAEANRRLVRMEPESMLHWMSLGAAVRFSLGPLAAAEVYAEAARRNPHVTTYRYHHAACLCASGRVGEARCILYHVLERAPQMLQNALDDGRFEALTDMLLLMEEGE